MDAKDLKALPLFAGLGDRDLQAIARHADELDVGEGKTLATEDAFGHEFCVIERGTAEVRQGGQVIRELGPGDFFGEIAILAAERRTASVITTSPARIVVMHERALRSLEHDYPVVAERLRVAIEERLARTAGSAG